MQGQARVALALFMIAVISGCGSTAQSSSSVPLPSGGPSGGSTGPTGEVVVVTDVLTGAGQDPAQTLTTTYKPYWDEVFDYAIEQDADGNLVGGFAESWSASDDGLTWTFVIREGVKFHNGDTMTAADVAWSWNRLFEPESKHNISAQAPNLESITAEGNNVLIKTTKPIATLPVWWAEMDGSLTGVVYPQAYFEEVGAEEFFRAPIGTGPYKFVAQDGEQSVDLTAFLDEGRSDWQESRTPRFKDLRILAVPDPSTRLALLTTGRADLVPLPISAIEQVEAAGLQILTVPAASFSVIWCVGLTLNPDSPCDDIRVREALSIAIDREGIADGLYGEYAEPSSAWMSGPGSFGYPDDLALPEFDPERAKSLLAEAGFDETNPLAVEIQAYSNDADFPSMPTLAEAIAGYYQAIGVQATVRIQEWETQKGDLRAGQLTGMPGNPVTPVTLFMRGTDNRYYFPDEQSTQYTAAGATGEILFNNDSGLGAEQLAQLQAVQEEFDLDRQEELFADYHKWMAENWYHIPLFGASAVFGVSDNIAGWEARVAGRSYPHNLWSLVPAN